MEVRHAFTEVGGERYGYIPCLNDDATWIEALGDISLQHLAGWNTLKGNDEAVRGEQEALAASAARARALGATQ